jgi:hypothetical protein
VEIVVETGIEPAPRLRRGCLRMEKFLLLRYSASTNAVVGGFQTIRVANTRLVSAASWQLAGRLN